MNRCVVLLYASLAMASPLGILCCTQTAPTAAAGPRFSVGSSRPCGRLPLSHPAALGHLTCTPLRRLPFLWACHGRHTATRVSSPWVRGQGSLLLPHFQVPQPDPVTGVQNTKQRHEAYDGPTHDGSEQEYHGARRELALFLAGSCQSRKGGMVTRHKKPAR